MGQLEEIIFMSMIFETHAHYNDEAFQEDREAVFAQFPEKRIGRAVNIASDLDSIDECLELAEKYPFMYCALGIHPEHCAEMSDALLEEIKEKLKDERALAVGEIGLDYYWPEPDHEVQKYWFARQLQLAVEVDLPVVIHSREAAADTMRIMKENHAGKTGGVVHCYSYSAEMAKEFVKMGYYIGVGGVLTFKNARKLVEVAEQIPLEHLLLETDCPYLAPVPYRGKRNSSLYLPYVVTKLAQIKGISEEEVIRVTEQNAVKMYRL